MRGEGRSTRAIGPLRVSARVELLLDRSGRYLRTDSIRFGSTSAQTVTGFDGTRFIQSSSVPVAAPAVTPAPAEFGAAAAAGLRQELTLFLIGFFGTAFDGRAMTATSVGVAESPEGRADVVRLNLPNAAEAMLFVDATTRLPLMLSWQGGDPMRAIAAPTSPAEGAASAAGPPGTAEHRFHFGDYRRVGDVRWPFIVRHSVDGRTIEELRFERFVLNPAINGDEFRP
jgi:hypothetical protein